MNPSPNDRLRWYQFSLRTLLVLVLLGGPGLAWTWRVAEPWVVEWFRAEDAGGQVLPAPYFGINDTVQYFPPGPEFELAREAARLAAEGASNDSGSIGGTPGPGRKMD
jgi:hypothetical protein